MTEHELNLLNRTLAEDRSAHRALLELWRPRVLAIASRFLENADDAQDAAQSALIDVSFRLGEVRDPQAFPAFVRQATLSHCLDFRRRRATRRVPGPRWDEVDIAAEEGDVAVRLALREALAELPEGEREAFVMDHVEGLRHDEIARSLDISVAAVRSRLQSAKRRMRRRLLPLIHSPMPTEPIVNQLIETAFPGAKVLECADRPEAWLPFAFRLRLALPDGSFRDVDVRDDVDPTKAALLPRLREASVPGPQLLTEPTPFGDGWRTLAEVPNGQNLSAWAMEGTYHRFRTVSEVAFDALDRLRSVSTEALPQVTLADRFAALAEYRGPWTAHPLFAEARDRLARLVPGAERPLVYTDYLHFFPNFLRVRDGGLGEVVSPFGHAGDPLLGLAMVWIYDCYPVVHLGFVEQYLIRYAVPRSDFAIRLATQTMVILVRELPADRPDGEPAYWDALVGLLRRALEWMP